MKCPAHINRYTIIDNRVKLLSYDVTKDLEVGGVKGYYAPSRPVALCSFKSLIKRAWDVFTGKADALYWPYQ